MLYVTGDTHGDLDFQKILDWVGATKLNKDKDYLIILGDFGYVWENKRDNYEKEKLDCPSVWNTSSNSCLHVSLFIQ